MGRTLILTDDLGRGDRLVRSLGGGPSLVLHDLYGDAEPPSGSTLVISDVSALTSEAVLRLRRALAVARGGSTPFLALIHGNLGRGEIQATALGATRILPASTAIAMLLNAVAALGATDDPTSVGIGSLRQCAQEARAKFTVIFRGDKAPAPTIVDSGTAIVNRAIRESKVRDWLNVVASFDDQTHRHCLTVAGLAAAFARTLGLNDADSHHLTRGALLHDIGKARVPITILNKPAPLTPEERVAMDRHPAIGHAMLLDGGYDALTLAVVRSHHEYLDGTGYPDGLRAAEIPDLVRLTTICDIFAALIESRPYKAAKPAREAYAILERMGTKLDPDLVRAFGRVAIACEPPPYRASA
ncbi:HD-GYP domain-containing protein [Methylobacterium sp. NEAU K]|uniref:HD-GYP domain-containing protein n=1 Tax=Methylobacterium sp. NEAU K TaxID=3064946 RepID=UPI002732FCD0|nr:HD-GYP domain-containing protein [Methylobacterium sp. NEAU K]MDP4004721.1 HD-GYP domain-containing protein [Methylobacterium sp. NEAU K]